MKKRGKLNPFDLTTFDHKAWDKFMKSETEKLRAMFAKNKSTFLGNSANADMFHKAMISDFEKSKNT